MQKIELKEVKRAVIIDNYLKADFVPILNDLLDWRNRLDELIKESPNMQERKWYKLELKATDYIIQENYK